MLKYVEIEVLTEQLSDFFEGDQRDRGPAEMRTLARLAEAAHHKGHAKFILDAGVGRVLKTAKADRIAVRLYDLEDPENRPLFLSMPLSARFVAAFRREKLELLVAATRHA